MSGYTDKGVGEEHAIQDGTVFLQKPFTPEMLAKAVREALGRNRRGMT
jgi:hypothetical protein